MRKGEGSPGVPLGGTSLGAVEVGRFVDVPELAQVRAVKDFDSRKAKAQEITKAAAMVLAERRAKRPTVPRAVNLGASPLVGAVSFGRRPDHKAEDNTPGKAVGPAGVMAKMSRLGEGARTRLQEKAGAARDSVAAHVRNQAAEKGAGQAAAEAKFGVPASVVPAALARRAGANAREIGMGASRLRSVAKRVKPTPKRVAVPKIQRSTRAPSGAQRSARAPSGGSRSTSSTGSSSAGLEGPAGPVEVEGPGQLHIQRAVAPASAEADPDLAATKASVREAGTRTKEHDPAEAKKTELHGAAVQPETEIQGRAEDTQTGEMHEAEAPPFDASAFKAKLKAKIEETSPKNNKEFEDFSGGGKAQQIKDGVNNEVDQEKRGSVGPTEEATKAEPDKGAVDKKDVTPLVANDPGSPATVEGAEKAAPKPKATSELEDPLKKDAKALDDKLKAGKVEVTEDLVNKSNEPSFRGAWKDKQSAQEHVDT